MIDLCAAWATGPRQGQQLNWPVGRSLSQLDRAAPDWDHPARRGQAMLRAFPSGCTDRFAPATKISTSGLGHAPCAELGCAGM
ncbi:hypothetical protein DPM13_09660 [Paracoccus mutanolyticus]|uniref:Uncharacterized protein n=1 Tax=Paracoccus mutanolyticus TaxID=1499308 RepID=A0ABN5M5R1_9RHOB|nr:hypothetical protein [Paracoccus mutanolyticus]AWX93281.1 hypothetical protein DPM13_09660 [Paracoccus mutanolyticus]